MPYYAELNASDIVIALIETSSMPSGNFIEIQSYSESLLGAEWDGNEFILSSAPSYTWSSPDLPAQYWWVYPGAFLDRLGVDGMAIAGSDHPVCKAAQGQFSNRLYIDLKSDKLSIVLNSLKLAGQPEVSVYFPGASPLTDEKIAELLAPPTTDYERFVKGLQDPSEE